MSWVFKGRVTSDNVKDFHEEFNREVLPAVQAFLKKYNLGEVGSSVTYGDDGIDVKLKSKYVLAGGKKPWAESNIREMIADAKKRYDNGHYASPDEAKKFADFYAALPEGDLIGRRLRIPGSSKRWPNETFTLTGYELYSRYPLEVVRDRDGRKMAWEVSWNMRFVD